MLLLPCPHCGLRDHGEFRYGGDASKTRPAHGEADPRIWHDHLFLFTNPKGAHKEYWQHVLGCRQWMVVERDTVSQAITSARPAKDKA